MYSHWGLHCSLNQKLCPCPSYLLYIFSALFPLEHLSVYSMLYALLTSFSLPCMVMQTVWGQIYFIYPWCWLTSYLSYFCFTVTKVLDRDQLRGLGAILAHVFRWSSPSWWRKYSGASQFIIFFQQEGRERLMMGFYFLLLIYLYPKPMEECHPLSRWIFVPPLILYRNTLTDILGSVLGHLLGYSKSGHIDNDDQPS